MSQTVIIANVPVGATKILVRIEGQHVDLSSILVDEAGDYGAWFPLEAVEMRHE